MRTVTMDKAISYTWKDRVQGSVKTLWKKGRVFYNTNRRSYDGDINPHFQLRVCGVEA
jgi:hypothetical protein